jgi:transcriptional regulator with XRE-family HTH domain
MYYLYVQHTVIGSFWVNVAP